MVITINIRYTGRNSAVKFFLKEMKDCGAIDKIRSEPGNLRYEYYWSLEDPETVLLVGSWSSKEAVDTYLSLPLMETIAELREKYDIHMYVEHYVRAEDVPSDKVYMRKDTP